MASSCFGDGTLHGIAEWTQAQVQQQQTISLEWTPEEQAILEEGLVKFGCESSIIRYAKIAVQLKNKSVRDVAFRCRWMAKKEISPHATIPRRAKDKKLQAGSSISSNPSIAAGAFYADTQQLLQHNIWTFKQITANLATHQIHDNIALLAQARDNIFKILANLSDMGPTMTNMPPLPKLNQHLANSILPLTTLPIQSS